MAENWIADVLQALSAPDTPGNRRLLSAWQQREGGHTANSARYNWLNTTRGSRFPSMNSVGVRVFPSYGTGVDYTAQTILGGYPSIVRALRAGTPYQPQFRDALIGDFSKWVSGSRTSRPDYGQKVLGGAVSPSPVPPTPLAPPSPEVPAGLTAGQQAAITGLSQANERLGIRSILPDLLAQLSPAVQSNRQARNHPALDPRGTVDPPRLGGGVIDKVLAAAHSQIGKPYVFGSGPSTASFDCSDLIQWAYRQIGVDLPRVTREQIRVGRPVKWGDFQPGDLIFSNGGGHVVMYVGNGRVIAAPRTGSVVGYQPVSQFKSSFVTARRIL